MARTDDAERVAAYMVQKLFLAENVYLGPKFRNAHLEKEVADLLLVHRDQALVVQMKCQEDPDTRSGDKLSSWVERKARSAYKQLLGTVGTLRERDYWCTHPTLGLVNFTRGQLTPIHCIVVVEHRAQSFSIPATLPLNARGIPVGAVVTCVEIG